jgi:ABC-type dipeptide/oligopeptide/nickel transport system ATPase component
MRDNLLEIRNLTVSFNTDDGIFNAVDNVSFHVKSGEIVGLVGESGCGKSVTSLSILRLIPSPPATVESGQIFFNDQNLLKMNAADLKDIRGKSISMIFQEPLSALSPLQRIGQQLVEALKLHKDV